MERLFVLITEEEARDLLKNHQPFFIGTDENPACVSYERENCCGDFIDVEVKRLVQLSGKEKSNFKFFVAEQNASSGQEYQCGHSPYGGQGDEEGRVGVPVNDSRGNQEVLRIATRAERDSQRNAMAICSLTATGIACAILNLFSRRRRTAS